MHYTMQKYVTVPFLPSAKPHGQQVAFRIRDEDEDEDEEGGIFKKPVSPNPPDISPTP